ncbi:hypothetical protein J6590_087387 [Homalodisca vitripennis]|nr:hypothetical protein J6590_087387 [Homalodisca vitripennis]
MATKSRKPLELKGKDLRYELKERDLDISRTQTILGYVEFNISMQYRVHWWLSQGRIRKEFEIHIDVEERYTRSLVNPPSPETVIRQ